jgi:hypothetical protein
LSDGFLAIWAQGSSCYPGGVLGLRLAGDGHPLDTRSFAITPAGHPATLIAAASNGSAAYVVWRSYDQMGNACHLTHVEPDGSTTTLSDTLPILGATAVLIGTDDVVLLDPPHAVSGPLTLTVASITGAGVPTVVSVAVPGATVLASDMVPGVGAYLVGWIASDGQVNLTSVPASAVSAKDGVRVPSTIEGYGSSIFIRLATNGPNAMAFWYDAINHALVDRPLSSLGGPLSAGSVTLGSFQPVGSPAVVSMSDGYQLLFREQSNGSPQLVSLGVSLDGTLRSVNRSGPIPLLASISAARNGDNTIAGWSDMRYTLTNADAEIQAEAAPVSAGGAVSTSAVVSLDLPLQHMRALQPYGGGAVALWTERAPNDRLVAGRLTAYGKLLDGAGLRLHDSPYDQGHSALATDGDGLLVVWTEGEPYQAQALYAAWVSGRAQLLSASVKQLAVDARSDSDVDVAWNGNTYSIVYQRTGDSALDFAALRVDRAGNVIDTAPIALRPAQGGDANPHLSWSGSDYLLVWQHSYDPFVHLGEPPPCSPVPVLPAELFAQRISATLTPEGAQIDLEKATDYDGVSADAQHINVAFVGGLWLVQWVHRWAAEVVYARIDINGNLFADFQRGPFYFFTCDSAFLAVTADGWMVASQNYCDQYGTGVTMARIGLNGRATTPVTAPLSPIDGVEAFALTPLPLVAYRRLNSTGVYVDSLATHGRAAGH